MSAVRTVLLIAGVSLLSLFGCRETSHFYTITASAGAGGSISPSGSVLVEGGASQVFVMSPDAGYGIGDVLVDGQSVGPLTGYTFVGVTACHTIAVVFVEGEYNLIVDVVGDGSVTKNPDAATYTYGTIVELTALPAAGRLLDHWEGDAVGSDSPLQVTMDGGKSITAVFSAPAILLVDDDEGDSLEANYGSALTAGGYTYDIRDVSVEGSPDASTLDGYDIVVWFTGYDWDGTLSSTDQAALSVFLEGGGRLFLCGQDILFDIGLNAFVSDYLHVQNFSDDATASSITATDDEVSNGLGTTVLDYPFSDHSDSVTGDAWTSVSFNSDLANPCGIKVLDKPFRVVFFAFPFEALARADAARAATLMDNIIRWLGQDYGLDNVPPTVQIVYPEDGAQVGGTVVIRTDADDNRLVEHVSFRIDSGSWDAVYTGPFSYTWDTDLVSAGPHTIYAQAFDAAGNPSNIDSVQVNVDHSNPVEKYAVIVGVSDYKDGGMTDLAYADDDANAWYDYLSNQGYSCWVLGDDVNSYARFDGVATEFNVRNAVASMIALVDSNDFAAFVFTGHGLGDGLGSSNACMWDAGAGESGQDGYYWDFELDTDFASCATEQLFIFLDACNSGGMGEVVSGAPADHSYMTATCTADGYGWDVPAYEHGAWTYFFLVWGLMDADHGGWDAATCFYYAYSEYESYYMENIDGMGGPTENWDWDGPDSFDHPEEFDSDPAAWFYF